jgi:hypothetical protein
MGHVLVTSDDFKFSLSLPSHSANQQVCWIVGRTGLGISVNLCVSTELTEKGMHKGSYEIDDKNGIKSYIFK